MEIKSLFDEAAKTEIKNRIHNLSPDSMALWGKMNVAQMLSHSQFPILVSFGKHKVAGSFLLRLIGPLFKSSLYNNTPYKKGLPTDKTYIVADEKDFEKEKKDLLNLVNEFSVDKITDTNHPVFGKLTKEQWSKASWKHLDHHLRQFGV